MSKNIDLNESFSVLESFGAGRIDREKGILHGVVILPGNKKTANGNIYSEKALLEAVKNYEGAKMFIDHDKEKPVRSMKDFGGVYRNVRLEEGKVKGDLHIRPTMKEQVIEIAEMQPAGVALSIRDRGHGDHKNGAFLVEGFLKAAPRSADLVSEASSNSNLFEHNDGGNAEEEEQVEKKDITVKWLREERADLVEALLNEGKAVVVAQLEEANKKGKTLEESLAVAQKDGIKAAKTLALLEAKFDEKVHSSVLKAIEGDGVSLETAKAIIQTNKETVEALAGVRRGAAPTVKGAGARQEGKDIEESRGETPSESEIINCVKAR